MKTMRIPILILALILALTPAGLATSYGSLTLENFHIEPGDRKPVDVNASLTVGYGGVLPEGPARLDVKVTGDGKLAFGGVAEFKEGLLRAVLEKSKYRFEIPLKGLEDTFSQSPSSLMYNLWYVLPPEIYYSMSDAMYYSGYGGYGSSKDGPKPEDFGRLWDLVQRYAAYYGQHLDPAKSLEQDRKLYALLKPEFKGQEAVDFFGASRDLYRYEMAFEGSALETYYEAVYEADPELKALEEEAAELMEVFGLDAEDDKTGDDKDDDKDDAKSGDDDSAKSEDGSAKSEDDSAKSEDGSAKSEDDSAKSEGESDGDGDQEKDPLDQFIDEAGVEKIAFVLWSDTEELADPATKAQKTVLTLTVKDAVDAYGMPVVLEIPITTSWREIPDGRRYGFEAAFAPYEGESTKISVEANLGLPNSRFGTSSTVSANLDVNSEADGVVFTARLYGKGSVTPKGVRDTTLNVSGTANGQHYGFSCAYDGKTASDAEKSGVVTLTYNFPAEGGGEPSKAVIRFDAKVTNGPYPPADFEKYADLQPVNPLRASYKTMDKVSKDLSSATMQGMGVLMQTHGLSSLMGGLMSGMIPQ
jgi:hypothetical protein